MKRYEMIKDKKYFNYIIRNGIFKKSKYYILYYVKSEKVNPFFGIAIKNSIGNAVLRNRLKRQTRSIIDKNKILFKNNKDYIIMIREECKNSAYSEMNDSLVSLLKGIE